MYYDTLKCIYINHYTLCVSKTGYISMKYILKLIYIYIYIYILNIYSILYIIYYI